MIPRTLAQIARVTGGELSSPEVAEVVVDGPVVTDSRQAGPGSLYVARIGERADGHVYTGSARDRGAVAALVTTPVSDLPFVIVTDVQEAFAALATSLIDNLPELTVVGVTGSSGKTTTKDLIAHVLARHAPTLANVGSLNSEVGVPLTVCRLEPETRFLVLEMGARGIGHIDYLTGMTHPAVGVVLNVGSAHMGEFGSREAIGRAKAELPRSLPAGGLAVLNADDDVVASMPVRDGVEVARFGAAADADVRGSAIEMHADGCPSFELNVAGDRRPVRLGLMGEHQVWNALAAAAVALWTGMSLDAVVTALESARPASRYRMERSERADGVTVVNDAYNANPESMTSAVRTLAIMAGDGDHRRRTVVALGPMFELGTGSEDAHAAVGRLVAETGVDVLVAVGEGADADAYASAFTQSGGGEAHRVPDVEAAASLLDTVLRQGDVVLVKSSHSAGLWELGERMARKERP